MSVSKRFAKIAPDLLRWMHLSREGDRREGALVRQGTGWFHLPSAGHEAIAALGYHLKEHDFIFPAYRDRALMHVRGVVLEDMARDFFARQGSTSEGRNLPGHFSSRRLNVFSVTSPVGAQCLPAVGAAIGLQRERSGAVVLCHIGDAATRQGEFYEAVCLAIQEHLPIIFVVEDNGYGISTPTHQTTPRALGVFADGLIEQLDGRDAEWVYSASGTAILRARRGGGPRILWCEVDRLTSHANSDDHRLYRSDADLLAMASRDPIDLLAGKLVRLGVLTERQLDDLSRSTEEEVRAVYERIEAEPLPMPEAALDHLFGPIVSSYPPLAQSQSPKPSTMQRAVNEVLRSGLDTNPRVLLLGQDIEDPKGGVFGLTRGLSRSYPGRVLNAPLAEASIVGAAVGLAATGWRPVFELQFIDFVGPAFNQLISQVTNLRWRTKGEWTCPLVLYAPYGAYMRGGGMWHSQSNEGWFAHMPGLRIAVPSTPQDAAGLFWTAMHDDDPSLILLPKSLFYKEAPTSGLSCAIPFGRARLVKEGGDISVVTWGNGVTLVEQAAEKMRIEYGVQAEILDLRTLTPCDWEAIKTSVAKTSRLVVVQEDAETCSFAHTIVTKLMSDSDCFYLFDAPPQVVSRRDVHVPFAPNVAESILPSVVTITTAMRATLNL